MSQDNIALAELIRQVREKYQEFFPDQEFNDLLKERVAEVQEMFKGEKAGLEPQIVTVGLKENGKRPHTLVYMIGKDFNEERYQYFFKAGVTLAENNTKVSAVFLMSEAWMRQFTDEEQKDFKGKVSEYPDKKEVIMIGGMTIDKRFNGAMLDLKREGKKIVLGDPVYMFCDYKDVKAGLQSDLLVEFLRGYCSVDVEKKEKEKIENLKNSPKN